MATREIVLFAVTDLHFLKVSVLPHKAERREGTCKFVCPVPNCDFRKEGSRVYIAKHFRVVHKDYRQVIVSSVDMTSDLLVTSSST